jgi:glutamine amidotransferase
MKQNSVAIIDYHLGNLFSVKHACEQVGMHAEITNNNDTILSSDIVIVPGVGAFEDAMNSLHALKLVDVIKRVAVSGKPLIGICLGMQLLMSESFEFGHHEGLDLINGSVVPFENPGEQYGRSLKVPQVCWNQIYPSNITGGKKNWEQTYLRGVNKGEFMYFVHSYYVKPKDPEAVLSTTRYGEIEFCSCFRQKNIFATQFHPERSGSQGLQIYKNIDIFCTLNKKKGEKNE